MTPPPAFVLLQSVLQSGWTALQPPRWLADEVRLRLTLLINHVLMQEPQAQARLVRRSSSVLRLRWGGLQMGWCITAAGLLEVCDQEQVPDLVISLDGQAPVEVLRQLVEGERPPVQIEGDVQLAAEVAWLSENLRWDVEEDLSRLLGDAAAHAVVDAAARLVQALRSLRGRSGAAQGLGAGA